MIMLWCLQKSGKQRMSIGCAPGYLIFGEGVRSTPPRRHSWYSASWPSASPPVHSPGYSCGKPSVGSSPMSGNSPRPNSPPGCAIRPGQPRCSSTRGPRKNTASAICRTRAGSTSAAPTPSSNSRQFPRIPPWSFIARWATARRFSPHACGKPVSPTWRTSKARSSNGSARSDRSRTARARCIPITPVWGLLLTSAARYEEPVPTRSTPPQ